MLAKYWHDCPNMMGSPDLPKHSRKHHASGDDPVRYDGKWLINIMIKADVPEGDVCGAFPARYCPWCGLELESAFQSKHETIMTCPDDIHVVRIRDLDN